MFLFKPQIVTWNTNASVSAALVILTTKTRDFPLVIAIVATTTVISAATMIGNAIETATVTPVPVTATTTTWIGAATATATIGNGPAMHAILGILETRAILAILVILVIPAILAILAMVVVGTLDGT